MRLLSTVKDPKQADQLSAYLQQQGIETQVDQTVNDDWGSHEYGQSTVKIWVFDEDQFEHAQTLASGFFENPHDPKYQTTRSFLKNPFSNTQETPSDENVDAESPALKQPEPMGFITRYLLLTCVFLLISSSLSSPEITTKPPSFLPLTPIYSAPINKALMYDYPEAYSIVDQLVEKYGLAALQTPQDLPESGKALLLKFEQTPYWKGIYPKIVAFFKGSEEANNFNAPMFERIKQGELWRLFTPCLLHNDLFHLFFNMIWLLVLGRQMESRLGKLRYLIFIVAIGVITNTAQYLMSGPNFLGFSGVLSGMLAFIWYRQKEAAWEGYQLEKSTIAFILFFILFMFSLQAISFFLEIYSDSALPIGIANTAHLLGALLGYLFAKLPFFSWHQRSL